MRMPFGLPNAKSMRANQHHQVPPIELIIISATYYFHSYMLVSLTYKFRFARLYDLT